uniref:Calcium-activated potassium channel subunit beta n=1 Tax=Rattus norvegicus TaxID=10116 RepID=A0A8I6AGU1_RAT
MNKRNVFLFEETLLCRPTEDKDTVISDSPFVAMVGTALPASGISNGDPLKVHPKLPSSAGEDRATLLGIAMMASSVLMFFLLGTTVLKPFMLSSPREESNCTTVHTHIADDWLDFAFTCEGSCQGQGTYPCLQVFVNLSHSGQKVLLHYDEEAIRTNPKCFYTPKCHGDRDHLLNSALDIKEFFDHNNGTFPCFYSPDGPLGVVLRKSGHKRLSPKTEASGSSHGRQTSR